KPRFQGFFRSRPVSRILSRVTISLGRRLPGGSSGVPGPSAGSVIGACFTLHRTGFGEPPCHHDAGGLLPHRFTLTAGVSGERRVAGGGLLSVPLSVGFRRLGFPQRPALRCPDFPRAGPAGPRSPGLRHGLYPAPFRAGPAAASRTPSSALPHSGQKIDRSGSRSTNSPQTRHSRLAPRKSACNSWSRERLRATTAPPMSEPPEDADDLAENVDVTGVDGLERGVLGLQPDGAVLPEEALDRRLLC